LTLLDMGFAAACSGDSFQSTENVNLTHQVSPSLFAFAKSDLYFVSESFDD